MTTRQGPPPKTADKTPEQVQDMAPAERDAYLQQKAEEGVDPSSWLFGPVQQWVAQAKAKNQAQQMGDKNIKDATEGRDVEYVQGLNPSGADYRGSDHKQLKQYLDTNLDVNQVSELSTAYHDVHQVFDKFATSMNTAVNASKGTWEGTAATNAQQYFTSLGTWSDANSQNAKLASETIYDQGQAASTAKNSMPAPIPFSWGDEFKSWATSNPFSLPDNVDKSLQKQKDSQAAHDEAAGVMATYDKNLYQAASKQPAFAPPPSFSTGGGTGDPNGTGDKNGINTPSSVDMPGSSSVNTPGGSTNNFTTGAIPGTGTPGTTGTPQFSGPGSTTGAGLLPAGTTTPSGFTPGSVQGGSAPNPNQSLGGMPPMSPMPMGGGMNFGGDEAYNSKVGGGAGRGGSGFGPGGSGGAGGSTGAGSASGAARPGGIGAAEAAAGRGMGGLGSGSASGRGGGMGGGGMGRGQKGEGDEDTEHSRPTYLVEGDPDEVFGTDLRTAPPVIGE